MLIENVLRYSPFCQHAEDRHRLQRDAGMQVATELILLAFVRGRPHYIEVILQPLDVTDYD